MRLTHVQSLAFRLVLLPIFVMAMVTGGFGQTPTTPKSKVAATPTRQSTPNKMPSVEDRDPEPVIVTSGPGVMGAATITRPQPFVQWSMTATTQSFQILRPGCYAARWAQLSIRSNSEVVIDFDRFKDLVSSSSGGGSPVPWELGLAMGVDRPDQILFVPADEFNSHDIHLSKQDAKDYSCDLWSRVTVDPATVARDYMCRARITVVLENAVDYAEPEEEVK